MALGIDVSNHQGAIVWPKVAADGVKFAWVKATEGRSYVDPYFSRNMLNARTVGIPVGAYHYARPDNNTPEQEADHFLSIYRPRPGDLLPVLDFEQRAPILSGFQMTEWASRWLELVAQALQGEQPVFYSYPYFIRGNMAGAAGLNGAKLWIANYGPNDGKRHKQNYAFPGFVQVAHQYTSSGRVGGMSRVDLNWADSLEPLTYGGKPPKPPRRPLPGPAKKPAWFWAALKEYLARRREGA